MNYYIVTVKLPKNSAHDPHNKKTAPCPVTGLLCTDSTGEHHSMIVQADSESEAAEKVRGATGIRHVTRTELTSLILES